MSSTSEYLEAMKAAFENFEPPYCSGTVPLDETTSTLYYRSGNKSEFIDFSELNANGGLMSLAQACQPASFGKNKEDVIDESYRKAGKLDPTQFATLFSPLSFGIIDTIRENLFRGQNVDRVVRAELYKLNVYGPGEFFKPHLDTPRSDTMFGSLVVILPTVHQGGSLIFRHQGKEHAFDTANLVSLQPTPHAAFVAFFSDVEHEVAVVTSGYRVSLTYNLYFVDHLMPSQITVSPDNQARQEIKSGLEALLADNSFLPEGGFVGFGLSYKYPIQLKSKITKLSDLERSLKGSDAILQSICRELSLNASLHTLYNPTSYSDTRYGDDKVSILLNEITDYPELDLYPTSRADEGVNILPYLKKEYGGEYVYDDADGYLKMPELECWQNATPVAWVKPFTDFNTFAAPFIQHFGNSAGVDYSYGAVCLIARVGPPEDRLTFEQESFTRTCSTYDS